MEQSVFEAKQKVKAEEELSNFPSKGGGRHGHLMRVCNLFAQGGVDEASMVGSISAAQPDLPEKEIRDAARKALNKPNSSAGSQQSYKKKSIPVDDGGKNLAAIINQGRFSTAEELFRRSPIRLPDTALQAQLLIQTLFRPDEKILIGNTYTKGLTTAQEAWEICWAGPPEGCTHIGINPFCGELREDRSGDMSYRCDAAVSRFSRFLIEWDTIPLSDQVRALSALTLPYVALIYSGGKSIHAWVEVDGVETLSQWDTEVRGIYDTFTALNLKVDTSACNPARFSRLPGAFVAGRKPARLLWLSETGREI